MAMFLNAQVSDAPTFQNLPNAYFILNPLANTSRGLKITWDNTGDGPITLEYSTGANPGTWTTFWSGPSAAGEAIWNLTPAQQTDIFAGVDEETIYVRMMNLEPSQIGDTESVEFKLMSIVNVTPINGKIIYHEDTFVINYAELYDSGTASFDISIGNVTTPEVFLKIYEDVPKDVRSVPFNAVLSKAGGAYLSVTSDSVFRLLIQGQGDHLSNYGIFGNFTISDDESLYGAEWATIGDEEFWNSDARRFAVGRRIGGQKAELLDETPVIAQFEADEDSGLEIWMRDSAGKLSGTDAADYTKAHNLVFTIDQSKLPSTAKQMMVPITFGTYDVPASGVTVEANETPWSSIVPGKLCRREVTHNFNLAFPEHVTIDLRPITSATIPDYSYPANTNYAFAEPASINSVYVYCVLKDPVSGDTWLDFPDDTAHFLVTMTEYIAP